MLEPTDIHVRRDAATLRTRSLATSAAPAPPTRPIRGLGTLLVAVGERIATPERHVHPTRHVPSG